MKRFLGVAGATLLVFAAVQLVPESSHAQVYQPYWTARPVPDDSPAMGVAMGFGDDMFRIAGHGRFSITSASDLGLELVFDNIENEIGDDDQTFGGGGDFKYLVVGEGERLPFDLAAQAGVGMQWGSDYRLLTVPFGLLGSKSIPVDNGSREITPFAGAYVIVEHATVEVSGADDVSDTDVSAEIRLGGAFQITGRTHAFAAIHAGNGTMFFLGFSAGL
ncbi:MAG TPA: hypothetical protein VEC56_10675 [Candidatus Krumholzibacteria bacterium]|nr:hypothetical protein [Candidatus Krumholzibacteria bacterium]